MPIFVFTVFIYGGLNHKFLLRFFNSFRFFAIYSTLVISFDKDNEVNLVAIDFGICFMIDGG